ncbi:hypothetical protein QUF75_14405 [Desulfococcaceae bacterium HSG7]|nr:hypothetical protein [Desulfococcaceae bacterium HSG7]
MKNTRRGGIFCRGFNEDDFAGEVTAPAGGIETGTFFETLNTRGLERKRHLKVYQIIAGSGLSIS